MGVRAALCLVAAAVLVGACSSSSDEAGDQGRGDDAGATTTTTTTEAEAEGEALRSPGCAEGAGEAVTKARQDLVVDGSDRWYLVTAPEEATGTEPVPLVLDFHGLSEGAEFHSNSTGWSELATQEGFVAVFPHGTGRTVAWNVASSGPNPDLDYVDALLSSIEQQYCIDTSRVYATGLSNGAFMSSVLACTRSEVFAAVAPVAGVTHPPDCANEEPVPVLAFHGTADPLLPFNGSVSADALAGLTSGSGVTTTTAAPGDLDGEGYPANAAAWAAANGCGGPTDEAVTASVTRRVWDCPAHGAVEFYAIEGGGHTWPGSEALTSEGIVAIVGPTNMEIDATALTWEFFSGQQLAA